MAGLEAARRDELGLFALCNLVQPRPGFSVLCAAAAMAGCVAWAIHRRRARAGCRLYRFSAFRIARPGRQERAPVAACRKGFATGRSRSRIASASQHGLPVRVSHGDGHACDTPLRYAVDAAALIILLARRRGQPPLDYQRLCWVIWGCLIGLPAFILAELLQDTTLLRGVLEGFTPPEEVPSLLYLLNSILCFLE